MPATVSDRRSRERGDARDPSADGTSALQKAVQSTRWSSESQGKETKSGRDQKPITITTTITSTSASARSSKNEKRAEFKRSDRSAALISKAFSLVKSEPRAPTEACAAPTEPGATKPRSG